MSIDNARLIYPVLLQVARELAHAVREGKTDAWISYEELCKRVKDLGIKESPRTIATRLLKPIQLACLEHDLPDLSSLVIQKPKSRGDFGNLIRPGDFWWEAYIERGETASGDVRFWFDRFKKARDFDRWPEAPFF